MTKMPGRHPTSRPNAPRVSWWRQPYVRHLRLPFNLLLSPIYLYGLLAALFHLGPASVGPDLVLDAVLAWASLHVFLYGGATAFNSYYDRDEGPVGGMLEPPAVDEGLLPFSLAIQAAGLPIALWVNVPFAVAWSLLCAAFVAYSHPAVRWKARPTPALIGIGIGQGALGFSLGWLVVAPPVTLSSPRAAIGMAATALVVAGLYVVTQSYQTAEDARRGDRTLPVLIGPGRALRWATCALGAGGAVLVVDLHRWAGTGLSLPVALFFAALGGYLLRWSGSFDETDVAGNYRRAMAVAVAAAVGLAAALLASRVAWHV